MCSERSEQFWHLRETQRTRILGTDRTAVVRDKPVEMAHMTETTYASAIGASAMGHQLPCASFMVNPMMVNTVKQNITRNVYQIGRLAHDHAGIEQKIKMADAVINGTDDAPGLNIATAERTRQT